jgi:hypothetical protein
MPSWHNHLQDVLGEQPRDLAALAHARAVPDEEASARHAWGAAALPAQTERRRLSSCIG